MFYVIANDAPTAIKNAAALIIDAGYPVWQCDGTDDQEEIMAAIIAANAAGGGPVLLLGQSFSVTQYSAPPSSAYSQYMNAAIYIKAGVTLMGETKTTTITQADGADLNYIIRSWGANGSGTGEDQCDDNISAYRFTIDGNYANQTYTDGAGWGKAQGATIITRYGDFDQLHFTNCSGYGGLCVYGCGHNHFGTITAEGLVEHTAGDHPAALYLTTMYEIDDDVDFISAWDGDGYALWLEDNTDRIHVGTVIGDNLSLGPLWTESNTERASFDSVIAIDCDGVPVYIGGLEQHFGSIMVDGGSGKAVHIHGNADNTDYSHNPAPQKVAIDSLTAKNVPYVTGYDALLYITPADANHNIDFVQVNKCNLTDDNSPSTTNEAIYTTVPLFINGLVDNMLYWGVQHSSTGSKFNLHFKDMAGAITELASADYNDYRGCTFDTCTENFKTLLGTHNIFDQVVQSSELDLSGAATDVVAFHADRGYQLVGYTILYTEASSADAGVSIDIGRYQSGVALDDDYFDTSTSEVSKALGYSKHFTISDMTNTTIAAGDTVTVGTAGGKTGTGAVKIILHLAETGA